MGMIVSVLHVCDHCGAASSKAQTISGGDEALSMDAPRGWRCREWNDRLVVLCEVCFPLVQDAYSET